MMQMMAQQQQQFQMFASMQQQQQQQTQVILKLLEKKLSKRSCSVTATVKGLPWVFYVQGFYTLFLYDLRRFIGWGWGGGCQGNMPFAQSGHMVRDHACWWAGCAVGLPKQCTCLCFEVPQRNLLTGMCDFVPCDRVVQRAHIKIFFVFYWDVPLPCSTRYAYTPGRLRYETDRAVCQKFWNKPLKKIHLSEAQASCDPLKIPKLLKIYFNQTIYFFSVSMLNCKWDPNNLKCWFCQNTQARQSIENLHIKYPSLFHTGLSPQLFGYILIPHPKLLLLYRDKKEL